MDEPKVIEKFLQEFGVAVHAVGLFRRETPSSVVTIDSPTIKERWFMVTMRRGLRIFVSISPESGTGYVYPEGVECITTFTYAKTSDSIQFTGKSNPERAVIDHVFAPVPLHHTSVMVQSIGYLALVRTFFVTILGWSVSVKNPPVIWSSGKCVFFENLITGDVVQVTFEEVSPSTPTDVTHLAFSVTNVEEMRARIDDWCGEHKLWIEFERRGEKMMISIPHLLSCGIELVPFNQNVH